MSQEPYYAPVSPFAAGIKGRCPRCGEGKLFAGYLTPARKCNRCDLDFAFADAGDGPAVFIILIVGFIVVGLALWTEITYKPDYWVHAALWLPLGLALPLIMPAASERHSPVSAIPAPGPRRPAVGRVAVQS